MPVTFFARIHAARKLLNTTEEKVVFYVTRAYDEYTTEAAKMDDELNFIGSPARVKQDYLANPLKKVSRLKRLLKPCGVLLIL